MSPQLSSYIFVLGEETAKTVKKFTDGTNLAVYEGEPDAENNAGLMEGYEKALAATRVWLRAVAAAEILESKEGICVNIQLNMPDRLLEVEVHAEELPFDMGGSIVRGNDLLTTPIGRMDLFAYRTIIEMERNPVRLLFEFFQKLLHQMHLIIAIHGVDKNDLLSSQVLDAHHIVDVLEIYKFDSSWYDINRFFEGVVPVNEG